MEEKCGVYKITNIKNNKCYIGSSKTINKRWYEHKRVLNKDQHHSIKLQRSWNKYGEENFIFEILCECDDVKLLDRENEYFLLFNPEYNILKNASFSRLGIPHTEETKQKLREANLGKKLSPEHKEKFTRKGIPVSEKTKKIISKKNKGKKRTEETKIKLKEIRKEEAKSTEVLVRLKEIGLKGLKNRVYKKGHKFSDEHKKKMSDSAKHSIAVSSYDIYDNYLKTFKSQAEAAKYYDINALGIHRATKSNKIYKGKKWKKEL